MVNNQLLYDAAEHANFYYNFLKQKAMNLRWFIVSEVTSDYKSTVI